jgi:hypothetical protein
MLRFIILSQIIIFIASCKTSKDTTATNVETHCSQIQVTYAEHIQPIILKNCATSGCHDPKTKEHGLDFNKFEDVKKEALSGDLLCTIKWEKGCPKMPMNMPKLSKEKITAIECWIKNGMPQ